MKRLNLTRLDILALGSTMLAALALTSAANGEMQKIGAPPEAKNMRLVGYNDLQARSAYQPTIVHQGDRYIAYIGHHGGTPDIPKPINPLTGQAEFNGTSIVDVTDPAHPKYLKHIPGTAGTARKRRRPDGAGLPGRGPAEGRSHQVLHAAHARHQGARDLGRHRSGQAGAAGDHRGQLPGHAQELVGMRHRHRLSGLGGAGMARQAHDRGL